MAPRANMDTRASFLPRLRKLADQVAREPLRFGGSHHSHVVCHVGGRWSVRQLVCPDHKREAYLKQHGMFMPEHAEMLSEPGPTVLEAGTLDELIEKMSSGPWLRW